MVKMIRDIVNEAADKAGGQCRLAGELGIDGSTVSRFLSGEAGLKLETLEALFSLCGTVVVPKHELDELKATAKSLAKFWAENR